MSSASRIMGHTSIFTTIVSALMAAVVWLSASTPVSAQVTAFKQAVAEAAAEDRDLAAFYRSTDFHGIWTDQEAHKPRRQALFLALQSVSAHGLPQSRYDIDALVGTLRAARTPRDIGFAEVALSKAFLNLADDMRTGVLDPRRVVPAIKRELRDYDRTRTLTAFAASDEPRQFIRQLAPSTNEYKRLMKEKMRLEGLAETGGWGPTVPGSKLEPGATGPAVVALRNRLMAKGYLGRTATQSYDATIQKAVREFQRDHGLETDGVAGASTLREINATAEDRLKSIIVAMERERWLNLPQGRGKRHILVNLTDFSARIMDDDIETFRTRAVIGAKAADRQSPEFSDEMEHMVINPTWHVPRSIAVNEYLPKMKRNRNAAGHMRLVDSRGRVVSRSRINFGAYNARTFPFAIKQPPSSRNALGLVKFMFPNKYNIYLHDTPQKHLFDHETRAYSHGCIRLHQPFDFAYALLARQEADPQGTFHRILNTGRETKVNLETNVPVHIIYRTAVTEPKGHTNYRADIYGRDARIWSALEQAGVSLPGVRG